MIPAELAAVANEMASPTSPQPMQLQLTGIMNWNPGGNRLGKRRWEMGKKENKVRAGKERELVDRRRVITLACREEQRG